MSLADGIWIGFTCNDSSSESSNNMQDLISFRNLAFDNFNSVLAVISDVDVRVSSTVCNSRDSACPLTVSSNADIMAPYSCKRSVSRANDCNNYDNNNDNNVCLRHRRGRGKGKIIEKMIVYSGVWVFYLHYFIIFLHHSNY